MPHNNNTEIQTTKFVQIPTCHLGLGPRGTEPSLAERGAGPSQRGGRGAALGGRGEVFRGERRGDEEFGLRGGLARGQSASLLLLRCGERPTKPGEKKNRKKSSEL